VSLSTGAGGFSENRAADTGARRTTAELLAHLRALGVMLKADGERLQVSAPQNTVSAELRQELARRKPEIMELLRESELMVHSGAERIEPAPRDSDLPLSFAQMRLWFMEQMAPGSPAYIITMTARLRGALNLTAFERTLSEIVRRHEALRTVFETAGETPRQVILKPAPVPLVKTDLTHLPPEAREPEARRLAAADAVEPFDLSKPPLFRTRLLRIDADHHLFVWAVHHAVFDGWSEGVFWQEFSRIYPAFCAGAPSPLPELPVQYADFVCWQRKLLDGPARERHMAYWREQLGGDSPVLDLPTDHPRSGSSATRTGKLRFAIDRSVCESLKTLGQSCGASLFAVLMSAFSVLLHRWSGQDDVTIGAPVAGRNRAELEGMIGFFINTIALRIRLGGAPSFRDLLAQVRNTVLDAHTHQDMPFEELVNALGAQRELDRTPLFQVFFNHLNIEFAPPAMQGLEVELFGDFEAETKYDLTLYSRETGGVAQFLLLYNAALFDEDRMQALVDQYALLLRQIGEDASQSVDRYSLATGSVLPDPAAPLASDWPGPVHERFLSQAAQHPHRIAIDEPGQRWTYDQLVRASAGIAVRLRKLGVSKGDVVAICAPRVGALVAALLGVLRVGAAFCVLNPAYPPARLISQVRVVRPRAWLRSDAASPSDPLEAAARDLGSARLVVPAAPEEIAAMASAAALPDMPGIDADSLAYVTFTSGTTGTPKAILGPHGPLSHFLSWHARQFDLNAEDRFSMLSGLAHDPLLRDVFTPLWQGATLCIPSEDDFSAPEKLVLWLAAQNVSVMHLTPTLGGLLTSDLNRQLPSLRYAFFGGEALHGRDAVRMRELAPHARIVNFYGATETPQAIAWCAVRPDLDGPAPVGKGAPGTQLLIRNHAGRLAGVGELGEIYVRSRNLARGYLDDERLTSERFVSNPFSSADGIRLYRTGDLGRYRADGMVDHYGRADRQLKIRGHRIEPSEIEAALTGLPGVSEAVVLADDRAGQAQLLAFYVCSSGLRPQPAQLRLHLADRLPEYMVPVWYVQVNAIPLTPNRKIDSAALLRLTGQAGAAVKTFTPAASDIERKLEEVWRDVLGLDHVGVHDNFFEIGGHSMAAARLVARLRAALGSDLPLRAIFLSPTIAGLAQHLRYEPAANAWVYSEELPRSESLVVIQPGGARPPLFFVVGYLNPDETLLILSRLAAHLGPDQPVYGFRPRWMEAAGEPYESVLEMAKECIADMRMVQPTGPYFVGGYCLAGTVALEIAQQLLREGEEVHMLALLDSGRPHWLRTSAAGVMYLRDRVIHIWDVIRTIVGGRGGTRRELIVRMVRRKFGARENAAPLLPTEGSDADRRHQLRRGHWRMMHDYRAKSYAGRILWVASQKWYRFDRVFGWKGVAAGGLTVYTLPGNHEAMLTTHSPRLAEILRQEIDSVVVAPAPSTSPEVPDSGLAAV
jgi:amino acid adenylation domain-containing protein